MVHLHTVWNIVEVNTGDNVVDGDDSGITIPIQDPNHPPICRICDEGASAKKGLWTLMLNGTDNATSPDIPADNR